MTADSGDSIRIMLLDEHAVVREGLSLIVEGNPGLCIVGACGTGTEALEIAARTQPDIVLMEVSIGGESTLELIPQLMSASANGRVMILTSTRDPEVHRHAVSLGATGLVLKHEGSEVLIKAMEKVNQGEVWLEHSIVSTLLAEMLSTGRARKSDPEAAKIATLSPREREVVTLIADGMRNRRIAETLFISEATVSHHLTSIFNKLGVTDRSQLIAFAYRRGLVSLKPPGS